MSRSIRSIIALLLSVLILFSLFGCRADDNGNGTTAADTTGKEQNDSANTTGTTASADTTDTPDTAPELNIEGNTLIFDNVYDLNMRYSFSDAMGALEKGYEKYKNVDTIQIGEGKLDICFTEYKDIDGNTAYELRCAGISAFGHIYTFEEPYDLYGNFSIYTFTADGAFVFEYENLDTFLINGNGVISLLQSKDRYPDKSAELADDKDALGSYQNQSFYSFTLRADGTLGYIRTPRKYLFTNSFAEQIRYCISLDEFAKEEGYVTFEDGQPVYHPEKKYTAGEIYDIEDMYDQIIASIEDKENVKESLKAMGLPAVDSFEAFLAYNKANYKEAE